MRRSRPCCTRWCQWRWRCLRYRERGGMLGDGASRPLGRPPRCLPLHHPPGHRAKRRRPQTRTRIRQRRRRRRRRTRYQSLLLPRPRRRSWSCRRRRDLWSAAARGGRGRPGRNHCHGRRRRHRRPPFLSSPSSCDAACSSAALGAACHHRRAYPRASARRARRIPWIPSAARRRQRRARRGGQWVVRATMGGRAPLHPIEGRTRSPPARHHRSLSMHRNRHRHHHRHRLPRHRHRDPASIGIWPVHRVPAPSPRSCRAETCPARRRPCCSGPEGCC